MAGTGVLRNVLQAECAAIPRKETHMDRRAPGALVTLRTSAADAAGGTVTETITSTYRIGR
jgi:hypothetical protein